MLFLTCGAIAGGLVASKTASAGATVPVGYVLTLPVLACLWVMPLLVALHHWVIVPLDRLAAAQDLAANVPLGEGPVAHFPVRELELIAEARNHARHDLLDAQMETICRLALAAEHRDSCTGAHIMRMGDYCAVLGRALGLPEPEVEALRVASRLHDIGKIGVPDAILQSPRRLTADERLKMEEHAAVGYEMLQGSAAPLLQLGALVARHHHERWDGTGYPDGLAGEEIPLSARICAVADVFDALTSARPYKDAMPTERALMLMREGRGSHFDPVVLDAFFENLEEVLEIRERWQSAGEAAEGDMRAVS